MRRAIVPVRGCWRCRPAPDCRFGEPACPAELKWRPQAGAPGRVPARAGVPVELSARLNSDVLPRPLGRVDNIAARYLVAEEAHRPRTGHGIELLGGQLAR